ncbi:MAG: hypothetical protein IJU20_08290 [Clostridia bacterium]|nr:hypothetical protein [Clostridia bacterium]
MKKLLTVLSVILVLSMMLAAFASCGSKDEKETDSESKQGSIETPGGNETEKETDSGETESAEQPGKETDKETQKETDKETEKETKPEETPKTPEAKSSVFQVFTEAEEEFIFDQKESNKDNGGNRYNDGNRYIIYKFPNGYCPYGKLTISLNNQYELSVSKDGTDFTVIDATQVSKRVEDAVYELKGEYMGGEFLYVKIGDAKPEDGWGGMILANKDVKYETLTAVPEVPKTFFGKELAKDVLFVYPTANKSMNAGGGQMSASFDPVDVSGYDYVAFTISIDEEDAAKLADIGSNTQFELTSGGKEDKEEYHWIHSHIMKNVGAGKTLVKLYFKEADKDNNSFDPTRVNFFRWYWVGSTNGTAKISIDCVAFGNDNHSDTDLTWQIVPGEDGVYEFKVGTETEQAIMFENQSNGLSGPHRFNDQNHYTIYGLRVTSGLKYLHLQMTIGAEYIVSVSNDGGENWTKIAEKDTKSGSGPVDWDLASYVTDGLILIKFEDYNKADGNGCLMLGDTTDKVVYKYSSSLGEDDEKPSVEAGNAAFAAAIGDGITKSIGAVGAMNFKLATPADFSGAKSLKVTFRLGADADLSVLKNVHCEFEVSSSGGPDANELSVTLGKFAQVDSFLNMKEEGDEVTLTLPISTFGTVYDSNNSLAKEDAETILSHINFCRAYWLANNTAVKDIPITLVSVVAEQA